MIRKIVQIDQDKCNGCGACAKACHEGAIGMVNGKAVLLRDDYCDGMGDCLPACPADAISFLEREAAAYDEQAVKAHMETLKLTRSGLTQWPVQIRLLPVSSPIYENAHILVAADCCAYAHGNFHREFMDGRVILVGCPKLDPVDYSEKLTAIFQSGSIQDILLTRMHVPCCGGMERAVRTAIEAAAGKSGRKLPLRVVTINADGDVIDERCE
ncbi:MAG: 4Fe-4S binding protein [Lachnospiraceae bacterium]|nr:4Fe-4S binding protein [Lachnospiraceae bacterium]MDY4970796.1 4Fe-4S binding protein [Lachnospiraceae bacterium]